MTWIIKFSVLNVLINAILVFILYKLNLNYEDLGKIKVSYKLNIIHPRRSLKPLYLIYVNFKDKTIMQTISKRNYEKLKDKNECYIYMIKFKNSFNAYLADYCFSLEEKDWKKSNLKGSIIGFFVNIIFLEFLIIVIGYQL